MGMGGGDTIKLSAVVAVREEISWPVVGAIGHITKSIFGQQLGVSDSVERFAEVLCYDIDKWLLNQHLRDGVKQLDKCTGCGSSWAKSIVV